MTDLADLVSAALAGGREVMRVYATEFGSTAKADLSEVTEADHASEAVVLAALGRTAPGVPVVAEEEVAAGRVPDHAERFFLVDPLDGTKEFVRRSGDFTVNVALVEAGVPVAGSRSHGVETCAGWMKRLAIERFVQRGSSLKFCLVAEGTADLYPRFGRTMEWDTAAGEAILSAAGGRLCRLDGTDLPYGKRGRADEADFANPDFLAFGDPTLAARLGLAAGG